MPVEVRAAFQKWRPQVTCHHCQRHIWPMEHGIFLWVAEDWLVYRSRFLHIACVDRWLEIQDDPPCHCVNLEVYFECITKGDFFEPDQITSRDIREIIIDLEE